MRKTGELQENPILAHINNQPEPPKGFIRPNLGGSDIIQWRNDAVSKFVTYYRSNHDGTIEKLHKKFDRKPDFWTYSFDGGIATFQYRQRKKDVKYTVWLVSRFGSMEWQTEVPFFMGDFLGDGKLCLTNQHGFMIINTRAQTKIFHKMECDYEIRKTSCIAKELLIFYCIYKRKKEMLRMWNSASEHPALSDVELGQIQQLEQHHGRRRHPRLEEFYATSCKSGFKLYMLKNLD